MDYNLIIIPILGVIIGYIINWIAIKMLFRSYTKKRTIDLKINSIITLINEEATTLAKSSDELEKLSNYISRLVISKIFTLLEDKAFTNTAKNKLQNMLILLSKRISINSIIIENETLIDDFLNNLLTSDVIVNKLSMEIESLFNKEKSLKEIVDEDIIKIINDLISFNEPKIKDLIKSLMKEEAFSEQVKSIIAEVISNKFGALGTMFSNPNSIYESIILSVNKKLEETKVSEIINFYINKFTQIPLEDLIAEDSKKNISTEITKKVLNKSIFENIKNKIINIDYTLYQCINAITQDEGKKLTCELSIFILNNSIKALKLERESIQEWFKNYILTWAKEPIIITNDNKNKLTQKVIDLYHSRVEKHIFQIVKKELNGVAWLGALLGFIISIILLIFR